MITWARGSGKDAGTSCRSWRNPTPGSCRSIYRLLVSGWLHPSPSRATWREDLVSEQAWREQRTVSFQGVHWSIWDIDWSPANGLLTFVSNDYQGRFSIWTIRPDGSDQKRVVVENTEISSARWAPQGDAIYYFRRLNQTVSLDKVFVQHGHENREAVATTLITGLETDGSLALSADGKRLVYTRAPYYSNLWTLEAGGHGKNQKTETKELTEVFHSSTTQRFARREIDCFTSGRRAGQSLYHATAVVPRSNSRFDSFSLGGVWSADEMDSIRLHSGGKPRPGLLAGGGNPSAVSSAT